MYLNFKCPACDNEIQAEYQHIGDWVACPVCNFAQVVPDPQLPVGASYGGYSIDKLFDSCLLWYGYMAMGLSGGDEFQARRGLSLMRIPTSFFLKNVSNLNAFAAEVLHAGTADVDGLAALVDKSLAVGKIFFVYSTPPDMRSVSSFVSVFGPLRSDEVSELLLRISGTMGNAWRRFGKPHLGLSPATLMLTPSMEHKIFDYGVSAMLLPDTKLISSGFNVWDSRYMSPEGRAGHHDFTSPSSDIFSLGAIAYLLLTGKDPFSEDDLSPDAPFPELPNGLVISDQFKALIRRMTAHSPSSRFSSWDELASALAVLKPGLDANPKETRRLSRAPGSEGADSARRGNVGLTHNSIKVDKKLKLHAQPKRKPQMGETVARLFSPMRSGVKSSSSQGMSSQERLVAVLAGGMVLSLLVLGGVIMLFVNRASAPPELPKGSSDAIKIKMMAPAAKPKAEEPRAAASLPEPAPQPQASAPQTAPKPQAPKSQGGALDYSKLSGRILDLVKSVDEYQASHPDAFDEVMKRYDKCSSYAFDTRDMAAVDAIKSRIDALIDRKTAKIDEVMAGLDATAQPLADAGNSGAARKVYAEYDGPYKAESKERRIEAAKRLSRESEASSLEGKCSEIEANARKLANAGRFRDSVQYVERYDGPLASETSPFRKLLAASLKKELKTASDILMPFVKIFAAKLAQQDFAGAQNDIQSAMKDPTFSPVSAQLESLGMSLELFTSMGPSFLEAMKRNIGKPVQLKVKGYDFDSFTVMDANDSTASVKVGAKSLSISFKDLDFASKMSFADSRCKLEDNPLVCALIALQSDETEALRVTLRRLPLGLETLLGSGINERDAKASFEKILDSTGLPYDKADYVSFLQNIGKKAFSGALSSKLHSELGNFAAKYPNTDFLAKYKVFIDELDGACIKVGAAVSDKVSVDPEFLKMRKLSLGEIIEKAPANGVVTVKAGLYQGGLAISRDNITVEGEVGAELEGGLKISGDKISVSKLATRKGRLEINGGADIKIDSCGFFGHGSYVKSARSVSIENSLFKGLFVLGAKELSLNHCTSVGAGILESKANTALLIMSDEISASNCIFASDVYGVVLAAKLESKKVVMSNCVLAGSSGACTELTESGGVSKNAARTDAALSRYMRGTKMIIGEPRFSDAPNGDYTLGLDSPGSSAASDGKDCGVLNRFQTSK